MDFEFDWQSSSSVGRITKRIEITLLKESFCRVLILLRIGWVWFLAWTCPLVWGALQHPVGRFNPGFGPGGPIHMWSDPFGFMLVIFGCLKSYSASNFLKFVPLSVCLEQFHQIGANFKKRVGTVKCRIRLQDGHIILRRYDCRVMLVTLIMVDICV